MMTANFAPLEKHGEFLAGLAAAGDLFVSADFRHYLRQAGRSPLFSLLQTKKRGVDSAAGAGAGPENKL